MKYINMYINCHSDTVHTCKFILLRWPLLSRRFLQHTVHWRVMRPNSNAPCLFVIRHSEEKKDIWVKIYHRREWWLAERVVDLLSSDDLGDRPRSGVWRVVAESGQCRARLSRLGTQDPRTSSVLTTAHHSSFIQKVNQFSFEYNILENTKNSRFLRNDSVFLPHSAHLH